MIMQPETYSTGEPTQQPATQAELLELTAFAEALADAAGAAILPHFRTQTAIENKAKSGFDPVTIADRAAEQAMRDLIGKKYPKHGIVGEEFPEKKSRCGLTWVLDPVDGTRAFISGMPLWGVLIALVQEGRPVIGVIDQPYMQERFIGFPGGARFKRGGAEETLSTRACGQLRDAVVTTTDPHLFTAPELQGFDQVRAAAKLTRYGGDCYAYAMLALGHVDLVIESGLKQHDVAALIPVIEGAGGLVTNWRGGPASMGGQVIASGDPRAHAQALVALRRAATP
jgi:histidinol phosphatase-like enzyme (inositol monophosphatase family)